MEIPQQERHKLIKVLQVFDNLGMGGAETWIMEVLRYWHSANKIQIDFLIAGGKPGLFDAEAKLLGAKIFYLKYSRATLFQFIRHFRKILKSGKYDIIHDHSDYSSGWHFLMGLGLLPGTRVTHIHNGWMNISMNYNVSPARKWISGLGKTLTGMLATHICGTSAEVLLQYGFDPSSERQPKVSVLHCGFRVDCFNKPDQMMNDRLAVLQEFNWTPECNLVLFAGRLDRAMEFNHPQNNKNSWLALHIMKSALKQDSNLRFIMAGAGDQQRIELEKVIEGWKLENSIKLIGVRRDISRLMRAASVLLFPSRQEGLGMVAVEAQATGLPVLASDTVPKECIVVKDLYHSISLNAPLEVWSAKLIEIINADRPDPVRSGKLVQASAFSIEHSAASLEQIYSGIN